MFVFSLLYCRSFKFLIILAVCLEKNMKYFIYAMTFSCEEIAKFKNSFLKSLNRKIISFL